MLNYLIKIKGCLCWVIYIVGEIKGIKVIIENILKFVF